jgi:hypothetical protein
VKAAPGVGVSNSSSGGGGGGAAEEEPQPSMVRQGGLGAATRAQPRFQSCKASEYDRKCRDRLASEHDKQVQGQEARAAAAEVSEKEAVGRQQLQAGWQPKYSVRTVGGSLTFRTLTAEQLYCPPPTHIPSKVERKEMYYLHATSGEVSWTKPLSDVFRTCATDVEVKASSLFPEII